MLTAYAIDNGRMIVSAAPDGGAMGSALWIDLLNPTPQEDAEVQKFLGIEIPTREEMAPGVNEQLVVELYSK